LAFSVWAAWSTVHLLRTAAGLPALARLRRDSSALDAAIEAKLTTWHAASAAGRRAAVRISNDVDGACAVGFIPPVILLSSRLIARLDTAALESIVLHEQAHLDRRDDWWRLAEQLIRAAVGLHPAVHWITRQIDLEREMACDQAVVARTKQPADYARSLTAA